MKKILLTLIFSVIFITSTSYAFAQMTSTHVEDPIVILEPTQGEIIIEFFHLDAPKHVENFMNDLVHKFGIDQ